MLVLVFFDVVEHIVVDHIRIYSLKGDDEVWGGAVPGIKRKHRRILPVDILKYTKGEHGTKGVEPITYYDALWS